MIAYHTQKIDSICAIDFNSRRKILKILEDFRSVYAFVEQESSVITYYAVSAKTGCCFGDFKW